MSDISLSKAVRSNLLSLQNTSSMMAKTQDRLASGNKVNSALDNPTNFFTAQGLNSRAGDLNQLMDGMANGIQTLEAADNGLTSITKTLESMQSTLRQARQDKSFQTQSVELDAATLGTSTARSITFKGGALDANQAVRVHNSVSTGSGGFAAEGTAGRAGTLTLQASNLNNNATVSVNFSATDTAETTAAKINTQLNSVDPKGGVSARVTNGQLEIVNAKGSAVTITGTNEEYIGLNSADVTAGTGKVAATAVGAGAVGTSTATGFTFQINGEDVAITANATADATANGADLIAQINGSAAAIKAGVTASNATGTLTLTQADGKNFSVSGASTSAKLNIADTTATTNGVRGAGAVKAAVATNQIKSADVLVAEINGNSDLTGKVRASNDNGKLRIENQSTKDLTIDGVGSNGKVDGTSTAATKILGNTVRADLASQFNELRDQLDKTADDASFNGINLLRGDNLKITFNETGTSSIDISTKGSAQVNAANMGVYDIKAEDLDSDATIDSLLGDLKTALNDVRSQSSAFGSNLSIVQNRQDFTKNMINTLQTGGANLTLADMNEEAANLLALQTRQSLSSSSLSLASQADQSVLQLLR
ncbi:flagellin N-terminal helical region [Devosia sp. YR412]|uniref:flagellin N-terminal helical domain-containing protein n=1 Tax=Devosia sp. YR412 TaxID=1881030 RepID=UPI0008B005BC|nr:flagellin [Devosia sp. YR412]SEP99001.1 flagellin N-terminal helical region [Devosia sp. YR412]